MENQTPTAFEYLKSYLPEITKNTPMEFYLIEFAKLHCEEQAKVIDKAVEDAFYEDAWDSIDDKNFVLKAYPLDKIK